MREIDVNTKLGQSLSGMPPPTHVTVARGTAPNGNDQGNENHDGGGQHDGETRTGREGGRSNPNNS